MKEPCHDGARLSNAEIFARANFMNFVVQAAEIQNKFLIKCLAAKIATQAQRCISPEPTMDREVCNYKEEQRSVSPDTLMGELQGNFQTCTTCHGIIDNPIDTVPSVMENDIKNEPSLHSGIYQKVYMPECQVRLEVLKCENYETILHQPVVCLHTLKCHEIVGVLRPCQVQLTCLQTKDVLKYMPQPKVCLGIPLSVLFGNEISRMNVSEQRVVKPKFNSTRNDLIRPTVKLSKKVEKLLDDTLTHPEKQKDFQCSECQKHYCSAKTLYRHVRLVHRGEFKYQCADCGRKFLNKHHYGTHCQLHLNVLRFECEQCGRKFVRKPVLEHYLRTEHFCEYKCPHCSKSYSSRKALRNHLRALDYKFQCPKCKRNFASFHTCRRHCKICV